MTGTSRGRPPTLAEWRAIARSLRWRALAGEWPGLDGERAVARDPDAALLALLDDPFESVADVHARLADAETHLRERGDRRSVFLTVYAAMTGRVAAGIESGAFEDPAWVRAYLVAFAERYRAACRAFERGAAVPLPWRIAFEASLGDETLLLQDALLGVNAHVNYDLAYALREVGIDPGRAAKRRDHDRIDGVLEELVDGVQRALVSVYDARGYAGADAALGERDEAFTLLGLRESRALAWRNAVRLGGARTSLGERVVAWRIRALATGAGCLVLAPTRDDAALAALRDAERDGVLEAFADVFAAAVEEPAASETP